MDNDNKPGNTLISSRPYEARDKNQQHPGGLMLPPQDKAMGWITAGLRF